MPQYLNRSVGAISGNGQIVTHGLRLLSQGQFAIQITGTFVGTLEVEGSVNGTDYVGLAVKESTQLNSTTLVTAATAPRILVSDSFGLHSVRIRASAWTSGTANILIASV
jgi:hypothetical protein